MKPTLLNWYGMIVSTLTLVVLLWFLWLHPGFPAGGNVTFSKDSLFVYHYDTSRHERTTTVLQPVNHYYYNDAPNIDTAAVLQMFFTKRSIKDLYMDSLIAFETIDTLHKNNIVSRKQSYRLLKPYQVVKSYTTTVKEETVKYPKNFYTGPFLAFDFKTQKLAGAGAELDFVTRRNSFGIGYDLLNRSINGKILFKIGK